MRPVAATRPSQAARAPHSAVYSRNDKAWRRDFENAGPTSTDGCRMGMGHDGARYNW